MSNPDCNCELAGYCDRHKVRKAARLFELCRERGSYWEAWEANSGPGQADPALRKEPQQTALQNHWCSLHYYPVRHADKWNPQRANRWYAGWVAAIPNSRGCGCREHWLKLDMAFDFETPQAFFESSVIGHNRVSESLGKPTISLAEAYQIWWKTRN